MLFHKSGDEIARAGVAKFIGKTIDIFPEPDNNSFMIRQQFFYKSMAVVLFTTGFGERSKFKKRR